MKITILIFLLCIGVHTTAADGFFGFATGILEGLQNIRTKLRSPPQHHPKHKPRVHPKLQQPHANPPVNNFGTIPNPRPIQPQVHNPINPIHHPHKHPTDNVFHIRQPAVPIQKQPEQPHPQQQQPLQQQPQQQPQPQQQQQQQQLLTNNIPKPLGTQPTIATPINHPTPIARPAAGAASIPKNTTNIPPTVPQPNIAPKPYQVHPQFRTEIKQQEVQEKLEQIAEAQYNAEALRVNDVVDEIPAHHPEPAPVPAHIVQQTEEINHPVPIHGEIHHEIPQHTDKVLTEADPHHAEVHHEPTHQPAQPEHHEFIQPEQHVIPQNMEQHADIHYKPIPEAQHAEQAGHVGAAIPHNVQHTEEVVVGGDQHHGEVVHPPPADAHHTVQPEHHIPLQQAPEEYQQPIPQVDHIETPENHEQHPNPQPQQQQQQQTEEILHEPVQQTDDNPHQYELHPIQHQIPHNAEHMDEQPVRAEHGAYFNEPIPQDGPAAYLDPDVGAYGDNQQQENNVQDEIDDEYLDHVEL